MLQPMAIPHPFPYQGSKRGLARHILAHFPRDVDCLIEPFCGSGAVSLAAAAHRLAKRFWLNDLNEPLMALWEEILQRPNELSKGYERLWTEQHPDKRAFFRSVRDEFNAAHRPHHLLYLLARIVKGSVRYSAEGLFNQSADNRRAGMRPILMQRQILGVHALLAGKTALSAVDFRAVVAEAAKEDLIYLDPPYQGTSFVRDHRYWSGLSYAEFADALQAMNDRGLSYMASYDGKTGEKSHGKPLPRSLSLAHLHIRAGRSSQATLLGDQCETVESLYLSPALVERLSDEGRRDRMPLHSWDRGRDALDPRCSRSSRKGVRKVNDGRRRDIAMRNAPRPEVCKS